MKKNLLALALVAGLTSFAGNAKADDVVFQNISTNGISSVTGSAANSNLSFRLSSSQLNLFDQVTLFGASGQTMTEDFNLLHMLNGSWVNLLPSYVTLNGVEDNNIGTGFSAYHFTLPGSFNNLSFTDNSASQGYFTANNWFILAFRNNTASGSGIFKNTPNYQIYNTNVTDVGNGGGVNLGVIVTKYNGVPEPSTYALFGLGALALVVAYRRKVA
jgi:hypothetical protein